MDERGIPSGPPATVDGAPCDFRTMRTIGTSRLDHALTGLDRDGDGRAWMHLTGDGSAETGIRLWGRRGLRVAPGLHRRPGGPGPPPQGTGRRAHDLPAERLRDRRG